jgi:hypothetical protein
MMPMPYSNNSHQAQYPSSTIPPYPVQSNSNIPPYPVASNSNNNNLPYPPMNANPPYPPIASNANNMMHPLPQKNLPYPISDNQTFSQPTAPAREEEPPNYFKATKGL